jgi:PAS domain S-box-containing protein
VIDPNFGRLVDALADAVVVADAQGVVRYWNPAAERIFGFTAGDALGQSMDFFIPERLRARHWEGYDKTLSTGVTKYGTELLRVPALAKDGRQISIAFTVALLPGADGKPAAIVAVIRDETQRFQEERNLKKRIAELEAAAK